MAQNGNVFISLNLSWDSKRRRVVSNNHPIPGQQPKYLEEFPLNGKKFDLNSNYKSNWNADRELGDKDWSNLLDSLVSIGEELKENDLKKVLNGLKIVCTRQPITSIGVSPYAIDDFGFKFLIDKFEDVIFIREVNTESWNKHYEDREEYEKKTAYWASRVKTIFTGDGKVKEYAAFSTTIRNDNEIEDRANENAVKFFCVTKVNCRSQEDQGEFLDINAQAGELHNNSSRRSRDVREPVYRGLFNNEYFHAKAMKWWIQGSIIGMNNIIVGYRTNNGILYDAEKINLQELETDCNQWYQTWEGARFRQ
uniref:Decapping nuclease n=1 Tax=Panagrolaimus sp. JU765 TaxID=591449 RepID=A0AC34R3T9_9BILA